MNEVFTAAENKHDIDSFSILVRRLMYKINYDIPVIQQQFEQLELQKQTSTLSNIKQLILALIHLFYFNQPSQAVAYLDPLTENNDDINQIAKFYLGFHFLFSDPSKPDIDQARSLYETMDNHSPWHQFGMGIVLHFSSDTTILDTAIKKFKHLIDSNIHNALFYTAATYFATNKYKQSFEMYRLAANHGYRNALTNLADQYSSGRGVNKDRHQAFRLYYEAAKLGDRRAQFRTGDMFYSTMIDCNEAYLHALPFYSMAAEQHYAKAFGRLGDIYHYGLGTENNPAKAAINYRQIIQKIVPKEIKIEFTKKLQELYKQNQTNAVVIYHASLALWHCDIKTTTAAFNELAKNNAEEFDRLMENDAWEQIQPLLSPKNAKIVYARLTDQFAQIHSTLQQEAFPKTVADLVLNYHSAKYQPANKTNTLVRDVNLKANSMFAASPKKALESAISDKSNNSESKPCHASMFLAGIQRT